MRRALVPGTVVALGDKSLTVEFASVDDLNRIMDALGIDRG